MLLQGFFHSILLVCEVLVSVDISSVPAGLGGVVRTYDIRLHSVHIQKV
jgi:hypothetical protein